MSQEMIQTLQSVINLLENPAFLKDDSKIVLVNDLFVSHGFCKETCEKQIKTQKYKLSKKQINNSLTLFEIIPDEIQMLKDSTKKLTQAMTLL